MSLFGRVVLNEPGPPAAPRGDEAAEALQAAMLGALAAHTTPAGLVDYRRLRGSAELAEAAQRAGQLCHVDLRGLATRAARLAFWINVYNALALHGAIALRVRRGVRQVWGFFGRVSYAVGGFVLSLDEIEHGVLRGNRRRALPPWPPFGRRDRRLTLAIDPLEPRIHFALNCGARSCPPVGVYRAAAIDAQLELAARNFVNQEVALDARGRVACSRILKWYGADFGPPQALREFLLARLDEGPARRALAAGAWPCRVFRPYSWAMAHPPVE